MVAWYIHPQLQVLSVLKHIAGVANKINIEHYAHRCFSKVGRLILY